MLYDLLTLPQRTLCLLCHQSSRSQDILRLVCTVFMWCIRVTASDLSGSAVISEMMRFLIPTFGQ